MCIRRVILLFLVLLFAQSSFAQSKYNYLHDAVNEIHAIQRKSLNLSAADASLIATISCNTLGILLDKDPGFRKDIDSLAKASASNAEYQRQLADDLIFFIDSFVPAEHTFLIRSGVQAGTTADILVAATLFRSSLREPLSADRLLTDMEKLRVETCEGAKVLAKGQEDEVSQKQRRRTTARWVLGLGGLSLVAADAVFAAPTGGIAGASFVLGGAGVAAALTR